jgi:UDP-N-acetylglucosamine 2-epimerase (non-hydrolysing)
MKIILVAGARPNFVKIAPLIQAIKKYNRKKRRPKFKYFLVHTGQHYDYELSHSFFRQLRLPDPDFYLGVGSGSHAVQTSKIMIEFEKVCFKTKPDIAMVVGDVNSTMACAIVASKLGIRVAHIEAGLRSFDRSMPEEINRIITDHISDLLFTSCKDANENLIKEGIPKDKIHFVGNVMIDSLKKNIRLAQRTKILERLDLKKNGRNSRFGYLTLHRPSNVDDPVVLGGIVSALKDISSQIPIVFPAHPRTAKQLRKFALLKGISYSRVKAPLDETQRIIMVPPLSYLDSLSVMSAAAIVFTDSGGIQEETTILRVPCLTLRNNTERPVTLTEGTNFLVGNNPDKILRIARTVLCGGKAKKKIRRPTLWDGKAAHRIINILAGCAH